MLCGRGRLQSPVFPTNQTAQFTHRSTGCAKSIAEEESSGRKSAGPARSGVRRSNTFFQLDFLFRLPNIHPGTSFFGIPGFCLSWWVARLTFRLERSTEELGLMLAEPPILRVLLAGSVAGGGLGRRFSLHTMRSLAAARDRD